jgi:pimeloyl-ACP methyl ester carboxylesterase
MGIEKCVRSEELTIWSERSGNPKDPAVLLVMGTSSQAIGWPDELVEVLVQGGLQVLRFDHRDTGKSSCTTRPYTIADMASDALAVLDGHQVDAAHVVGASLGGAIVQWLAVHRPERVLTLTSIMSGPLGYEGGMADVQPRLLAHFATLTTVAPQDRPAADLETWRLLNGEVLPFDEAAARRHIAESLERATDPIAALNHQAAGARMTPDRKVPLESITAPTLIVHGTADPLRPVAHGEAVAAAIPQARIITIPGMGHGFFSPGLAEQIGELILGHVKAGHQT